MADVVHPLNGTPSDVPMRVSPIKPVTDDPVTTDDDSDLDFDLDSLDDEPAPRLSRGNTNSRVITDPTSGASANPPTHPFLRKASSSVDEKVDDWIRTSRHRLLADASVDGAPDLCRALVVYKAVGPAGAQTDTDEAGGGGGGGCGGSRGEAGGDPTPSPMAGSDSGDGIAVAGAGTARARGAAKKEQFAGSSTAEATGSTGGGGGRNGDANSRQRAASHGLAGLCVSPSGGDDAGGAMSDRSDATGKGLADEMEVDAATEGAEVLEPFSDDQPDELPGLTRVGTSRGIPTPELTPEWAAQARVSSEVSRASLCLHEGDGVGWFPRAAADISRARHPPDAARRYSRAHSDLRVDFRFCFAVFIGRESERPRLVSPASGRRLKKYVSTIGCRDNRKISSTQHYSTVCYRRGHVLEHVYAVRGIDIEVLIDRLFLYGCDHCGLFCLIT